MKNTSAAWKHSSVLILSGVINAFILIVRIPFFWQVSRTMRILLLVISSTFLSAMYMFVFNLLKKIPKQKSKNFLLILVGLYFLFCCFLIMRNDLPKKVAALWLHGLGQPLIKTTDIIFFVIAIIYIRQLFHNEKNSLVSQLKEKHIYDIVFVCALLLICLLPLKNMKDVNSFDQSFWGRDMLIKAFQSIRLGIGDQVFEKSIRADDNWLIYTGEISIQDYQNTIPLNENQLETIYTNLKTLDDFLQSRGISLLVVIPPNKNTIYPEYVPSEIPVIGEISRLDQVINYQKEHNGVEILDLRQPLWNANKHQQVFYSTDTHWNLYGAYIAYQEIINTLHEQFPNIESYPLDNFEFVSQGESCGDLARTANINVVEEQYELKLKNLDDINIEEVTYSYNANKTAKIPLTTFINDDETLPDVFIYHDSFSNNLKYYLPLNFHKTTFLYHLNNNLEFVQIESENPDIVILEFNERYLAFLLYKLPE